jgi:alkyl sulfatase BDS1-like metallo-beta-lactamase superfamily hydrolase
MLQRLDLVLANLVLVVVQLRMPTCKLPSGKLIVSGGATFDQKISAGDVKLEGRREALEEFLSLMDTFAYWFNIVTPRPPYS